MPYTIGLHEPEFDKDAEEAVLSCLRSSWVSTGGPFIDEFAQEFCRFTEAKYAIPVSSGTTALFICIETLKRQRNIQTSFEVMVPTLSFIASANAVVQAGGKPVFVDTAKDSLNMDVPGAIQRVKSHYQFDPTSELWISKSSGAPLLGIMPVHIMGWAIDIDALAEECSKLKVDIIEDAAEALGVRVNGRHVGTRSRAGAFSFNGNKTLTTGAGGMIVTNDAALAKKMAHISSTAKTDALNYIHDEVAYNFRMPNILAALGCTQLKKLPETLRKKRQIFETYKREFENVENFVLHEEFIGDSNYWMINLVVNSTEVRDHLIQTLEKQHIQSRPLWTPIHLQPAYQSIKPRDQVFPHCESLWRRVITLPSSPKLTDEDISTVVGVIKTAIN